MCRLLAAILLLVPTGALGAGTVVTKPTDGDTIETSGRDVRLQGIDAPKSGKSPPAPPLARVEIVA